MAVPFLDLKAQYQALKPEMDAAIQNVLNRTAFIGGPEHKGFEADFAAYCGRNKTEEVPAYCASCGNGTDALYLALRALGVGPGDEVITVSYTFIATSEAITLVGAKPVFVEALEGTMLMDPDALEAAITPQTKAVIAVHLHGQPCEMGRILEIARRHGLKVIEDAAQAHGAYWGDQRVGTLGDVACFSFYPGKNLGAYGDGGAVVSRDEALIQRIRMVANHGRTDKYLHEMEGVNSRLDNLHAAVLQVKLPHLDQWNEARRRHAATYLEGLKGSGVVLPEIHPDAEPVWHLFVARVPDRDRFQAHLKEKGVATGVHYPIPLHRQPAYEYLGMPEGSLPVTEKIAATVVSLPMFPELTDAQKDTVIQGILDFGF